MKKLILTLSVLLVPLIVNAQVFHSIDEDGTPSKTVKSSKVKDTDSAKPAAVAPADSEANTSLTPDKAAAPGVTVSGVVRAVRGYPTTEVFFKDLKDSYFIDPTSEHDEIMKACLQSSRDGKAVSLRVDPTTRHVYSLSDQDKGSQDQGSVSSKVSRPGSN
jgi:hypothetical protein